MKALHFFETLGCVNAGTPRSSPKNSNPCHSYYPQ